jgi:hypothetical protein
MPDEHHLSGPIFLVGAERSGSTLLRLMLDGHPRIAWLNEFEYAVDLMKDDGACPRVEVYTRWLATHRIFQASGLRIDNSRSYADNVRSFPEQHRARRNRPVVGATVHRHFDRLLHLWPEAGFIHIIRDPRDVARSCIGMGWAGNVHHGVERWLAAEHLWDRLTERVTPARRLDVKYEELVRAPEQTLRDACAFIGVAYDPAMVEIDARSTYERPNARFANQWASRLSPMEIRLVEARTLYLLIARGYEPSGLPILRVGPLRQFRLGVQNRASRLMFRIRRFGFRLWAVDLIARRLRLRSLQARTQQRINAITTSHLQ